jgi:hypothetical protein
MKLRSFQTAKSRHGERPLFSKGVCLVGLKPVLLLGSTRGKGRHRFFFKMFEKPLSELISASADQIKAQDFIGQKI